MITEKPDGLALLRHSYRQRLPSRLANWHEFWLRYCLELALGGLGCVAPNPLVGAVLVRPRRRALREFLEADSNMALDVGGGLDSVDWQQDFEILGQGYHVACGQLHAEAAAFADALQRGYGLQDFRQTVLYCNLEPCSFRAASKKQPPCCEQLVRQQVGAVVFANSDPNPSVDGASVLRHAGLAVRSGDFALPSAMINQIFLGYMAGRKRPWVSLKLAQSLDACIATKSGHSRWISGPAARAVVQALRASHGAAHSGVAVGRATLEVDDPSLLLRPEFLQQLAAISLLSSESRRRLQNQQPWRIVWDSGLRSRRLPLQFYRGPHKDRSIAISNQLSGNIVVRSSLHSAEGLREGLAALTQPPYNIQYLLLEGGSRLASSFLTAALVDEVYCFVSQRFIGNGLRSLGELQPGQETVLLPQTLQLRQSSSMPIREHDCENWSGPDEVLCHGYLSHIFVP